MSEQKPLYPEAKIIRRLSQWAPDPQNTGERANLNWQLKGSNLELIVWARGASEKGKPPIRANLNSLQAMILIEHIRMVADSQSKDFRDLPLKNMRKTNKDDPDSQKEMYDQATVRVVKTSEGLVQIGIFDADESRSRILFPFLLDRWTGLVKHSGEPLNQSEVSAMVAKCYANILHDIIIREMEITSNTENNQRYQTTVKPIQTYKKPSASDINSFEDITF